jgi:hypothetical protein
MDAILLLLFIFIAFALIIGLPVALTIYGYKKLRKTKFKKYAFLIPTVIIGLLVYEIYVAIYPLDSFYKDDFKTITGVDLDKSAIIKRKNASYPDVHGSYCSCALIKLDKQAYTSLLDKVKSDTSFNGTDEISSEEYEYVTEHKDIDYLYKAIELDSDNEYKFIGFLKDGRTIIIHLCT